MRLIWYQRQDGLWNAACACNTTIVGVPLDRREEAETSHFTRLSQERAFRTTHPARFAGIQIPACGPQLPEPNPNNPGPLVFP